MPMTPPGHMKTSDPDLDIGDGIGDEPIIDIHPPDNQSMFTHPSNVVAKENRLIRSMHYEGYSCRSIVAYCNHCVWQLKTKPCLCRLCIAITAAAIITVVLYLIGIRG